MLDKRKMLEEFNSWLAHQGMPAYTIITGDTCRYNPAYPQAVEARRKAYTEKIVRLNREAVLTRLPV